MDNKKLIGQRINIALASKNIKQKELAEKLSVSDNTISYFVSGKRTPNTEQIIKISQILDVSTDYLLGRSENLSSDFNVQAIGKHIGLSDEAIEILKDIKTRVESNQGETYISANYFTILNYLITNARFLLVIMAIDKYAQSIKNESVSIKQRIEEENQFFKGREDETYEDCTMEMHSALDSFFKKEVEEIENQQVQLWRIQQTFIEIAKTIAEKKINKN